MILSFSNNCDKKLIPLLENFRKCITVPSVLEYLLNHKNWDNVLEEVNVILIGFGSRYLTYVCRKKEVPIRKISWKKDLNKN